MNGLKKAINKQGGLTALGRALGVSKGVVFNWTERGNVPAPYCPEIEKLTGVPSEELNSEVDWTFIRNNQKPRKSKKH
jgi:DNA-binding transcriptional regulator YdaS (Cro superfamily)